MAKTRFSAYQRGFEDGKSCKRCGGFRAVSRHCAVYTARSTPRNLPKVTPLLTLCAVYTAPNRKGKSAKTAEFADELEPMFWMASGWRKVRVSKLKMEPLQGRPVHPLRVTFRVISDLRQASHLPYASAPGFTHGTLFHEYIDLLNEEERPKVWRLPEVCAADFLGQVILDLNDRDAGLFTTGCMLHPYEGPPFNHAYVYVSSLIPEINRTPMSTLKRLAEPLIGRLSRISVEGKHGVVDLKIWPYLNHFEHPLRPRWTIGICSHISRPDLIILATGMLKTIAASEVVPARLDA